MSGIAVIYGKSQGMLVQKMLLALKHRGLDGSDMLRIGDTTIGHSHLTILHKSGSRQPMTNERGDLAIAFDGEIYNHQELRRALAKRRCFKTATDAELLLHAYAEEGADILNKLDGRFALALSGPEGLLLARDPLGIRPLYYGQRHGQLMAASELKAFPAMDDLCMLPAGHALQTGAGPWRFAPPFPPEPMLTRLPLDEICTSIRRLLEQAVAKRLLSDAPLGVYLSGGLDSSLVAALIRPHKPQLHSFTAGMRGAPDLTAARNVARLLGTKHHELLYSAADVRRALPEVIRRLESFDAPLVRSAVPMYFVSKLAAQHVRVALCGEGADELFAGYAYLAKLNGGRALKRELAKITTRLQDTSLQRVDRMSMAHGLVTRVPFLDQALVRYTARLPVELLMPHPKRPEKWLLRKACQGLLPPAILQRKKMKFSEGAGSHAVGADWAEKTISRRSFEREREPEPGVVLRSPEELLYYRFWREAMSPHISARLVGRTLDSTAARTPKLSRRPKKPANAARGPAR